MKIGSRPRLGNVLLYFSCNQNRWVARSKFVNPQIGGSEGGRRLRELAKIGLIYERRKIENMDDFEYRVMGWKFDDSPKVVRFALEEAKTSNGSQVLSVVQLQPDQPPVSSTY